MRTGVAPSIAAVLLALASGYAGAESLSSYVTKCKSELEFSSSDMPGKLSCKDALIFERERTDLDPKQSQTNDAVGYARLTDDVDLVFACRWLQNGQYPGTWSMINNLLAGFDAKPPFVVAASVELLIHNRSSGKTCFFKGKEQTVTTPGGSRRDAVSATLVLPTASNAGDYWSAPSGVDAELPCADCHSAGPYIATPRIAPFLAYFGLLNDGHDVKHQRYQAIGDTFAHFNDMIAGNLSSEPCARACHVVAGNSQAQTVVRVQGEPLIPSIRDVIDPNGEMTNNISISTSGVMPPYLDPYSDYRWVNRDSAGGGGDYEQLDHVKDEYPLLHCANPVDVEAHVVGVDHYVSTSNLAWLPDKLDFFNLREGLVCKNSQQPGGQCGEYQTRYLCGDTWTDWYQKDDSGGNGDFEERVKISLPCSKPAAIQARTLVLMPTWPPRLQTMVFNGPNDRLRHFDNKNGLMCVHADQPDGKKCSNYTVRYICPD